MNRSKASFMIGICMKAGKIESGEFSTENAVRSGRCFLLILSEDASANTRKKFENMASWYKLPVRTYLPKAEFGRIMGKGERSCAAVTDRALAEQIRNLLDAETADEKTDTQA